MAKQSTLISFFAGKSASANTIGNDNVKAHSSTTKQGKSDVEEGNTEKSSDEEKEDYQISIVAKKRRKIILEDDSDEGSGNELVEEQTLEKFQKNSNFVINKDQKATAKTTMTVPTVAPDCLKKPTAAATTSYHTKTDEALLNSSSQQPHLWESGEEIPYAALCHTFALIETESSRLMIQQHLTELFRLTLLLTPNDLIHLIYLSSNTVAPSYQCVELGVGDSILIKAVGESFGTNPSLIKQNYNKQGDLGKVAQSAKSSQRTLNFATKAPKSLSVKEVLIVFRQIATNNAQKYKVDKIKNLLVRCAKNTNEAKFVVRGLQGKLRIGLAQSTVLVSLAHALLLTQSKKLLKADTRTSYPYNIAANKVCDPKTTVEEKLECAVNIVKKAYSELPSFDALVDASLKTPLEQLHLACTLKPGIPVEPMLAKPTKSCAEVLKRLNGLRFTCEYKYDGERAQIHMTSPDGKTKVFSRNLLDTSEKYPEVPLYVKEACKDKKIVHDFIMDTEVVAYNREKEQFVPFQILSTRKKTEESAESAKVQVIVQAFDLMYINGESLLQKTLEERRALLQKYFQPIEGKFRFASFMDFQEDGDTTQIEEFLDAAVKGKCEGLMVKTLDVNADYEPSRRSLNWLKLKKDYLEGISDSVDLVPIGAYHGKGKRTGVYGAYLLACYDSDTEQFQSVCKIGTGFSEEDLEMLSKGLNEHIIPQKSSQYNVSDSLECDVWFDAVQVWEVRAADLSKSSAHRGAVDKTGDPGRGIGLRFPRFEKVRADKNVEHATTSDQILDMYYAQESIDVGAGDNDDEGI